MNRVCMNKKKRQRKAVLILIAFLFAVLFSCFFLVGELGHECSGEGCMVCACMDQAEQLQKRTANGCASAGGQAVVCLWQITGMICAIYLLPRRTPVNQKTRMNP